MKTIYTCAVLFSALVLAGCADSAPASETGLYRVYLGTLAKQEKSGIYMTQLDVRTGQMDEPVHVINTSEAGFIAIHPNRSSIYATGKDEEFGKVKTGSVTALRIIKPSGTLEVINTRPSDGLEACYVSIDPSGKNLLVANYTGGSCAVLPIQPDGSLAPASSVQKHTGSSIHPQRQTAAFTHSILCDPSGHFAIVTDLGMDKIMLYCFDATNGTLNANTPPFIKTEPGGGPRHFTFHPSGKFAYANLELFNKVVVFQHHEELGTLTEIQTIGTLPAGFTGKNTTSEILTTPDGRFLYVGNRGHNSLAVFSISQTDGKLTAVGHVSTRGEIPRNFNIDPTGTCLLVANRKTGNIVSFRINRETGLPEFTGSEINVPSPTCIRFLPEKTER